MVKFRYVGDSQSVSVGIAGALFHKGVVNEVPDERLAAVLMKTPGFEQVTADMLPPVTSAILMHAPQQGSLHADPDVDQFIRDKIKGVKKLDHEGVDGLGNVNRSDQYAANVDALANQKGEVTELSSDSGGEEMAAPPAKKKAGDGLGE
jgi:hypothetical protein